MRGAGFLLHVSGMVGDCFMACWKRLLRLCLARTRTPSTALQHRGTSLRPQVQYVSILDMARTQTT